MTATIETARQRKIGTEFEAHETPEGVLLKPHPPQHQSQIEDVAGCLKAKRQISLAQMDAAVAKEVEARHARGRY